MPCPTACQTYRIVYQTVYEQQQFTAYRIEYETVCEERQVTSYKPVWETAVRENRYTVARPVMETADARRDLHRAAAGRMKRPSATRATRS